MATVLTNILGAGTQSVSWLVHFDGLSSFAAGLRSMNCQSNEGAMPCVRLSDGFLSNNHTARLLRCTPYRLRTHRGH
jgi:hypothetical protein